VFLIFQFFLFVDEEAIPIQASVCTVATEEGHSIPPEVLSVVDCPHHQVLDYTGFTWLLLQNCYKKK